MDWSYYTAAALSIPLQHVLKKYIANIIYTTVVTYVYIYDVSMIRKGQNETD